MNKEDYYMKHAELAAEMSHSKRTKVGAILVNDSRVVCEGRNGTISGQDNNCEIECPECPEYTNSNCKICQGTGLITSPEVIHAEQNLISFAAKEGIKTNNCTMYITLSPCVTCAKLIAQCGIKNVIYRDQYRDTSGIEFLRSIGIKIKQKDIDDSNIRRNR